MFDEIVSYSLNSAVMDAVKGYLAAVFDFSSYTTPSGLFGLLATLTVLASMQFKNIKTVLVIQIVCNLSGALSYLLAGDGISGFVIYIVAVTQSLVYLVFRILGKKDPQFLTWLFAALFVVSSAITVRAWFDVFSLLGAFTCALALAQKKPAFYRIIMVCNGSLWLAYDIVGNKPAMVLAHVITVGSAVVGILRMDTGLFKKRQKSKE